MVYTIYGDGDGDNDDDDCKMDGDDVEDIESSWTKRRSYNDKYNIYIMMVITIMIIFMVRMMMV